MSLASYIVNRLFNSVTTWTTGFKQDKTLRSASYICQPELVGLEDSYPLTTLHRDLKTQSGMNTPPIPVANGEVRFSLLNRDWKIADFGRTSNGTSTKNSATGDYVTLGTSSYYGILDVFKGDRKARPNKLWHMFPEMKHAVQKLIYIDSNFPSSSYTL